uniref:Uncharacterized protein n=1 Tax=Eutreptiella gymnastica TaxID=73025 RepID=A0A6T2FM49_9EUGL
MCYTRVILGLLAGSAAVIASGWTSIPPSPTTHPTITQHPLSATTQHTIPTHGEQRQHCPAEALAVCSLQAHLHKTTPTALNRSYQPANPPHLCSASAVPCALSLGCIAALFCRLCQKGYTLQSM